MLRYHVPNEEGSQSCGSHQRKDLRYHHRFHIIGGTRYLNSLRACQIDITTPHDHDRMIRDLLNSAEVC